jgi:hypothetical protein
MRPKQLLDGENFLPDGGRERSESSHADGSPGDCREMLCKFMSNQTSQLQISANGARLYRLHSRFLFIFNSIARWTEIYTYSIVDDILVYVHLAAITCEAKSIAFRPLFIFRS